MRNAHHHLLLSALLLTSAAASADPLVDVLARANEPLQRVVLENGMTCLVKEDPSAAVVSVQVWIGTGAIHEGPYLGGGLSHYVEHMIFKGTDRRKATEITRDIDEAGGRINAYTSMDRVVIYCTLPSANWKVGVDVLSDAVMHSTFPEEEWEREKEVILREFAMGRDDPARVMSKLLWDTAYRVHPLRVPVIGYEDVFRTMGREELTRFYAEHYRPDNMITVVVGDIDAETVIARLRETYQDFKRTRRTPVVLPKEPAQLSRRSGRKTGDYEVTRLRWAVHTTELGHPDTPALDVLAAVVGHGRSSRLSRALKEEQQLAHEIGAWSFTPRDPGLFIVHATLAPENEAALVAAIEKEVRSWQQGDFTEAEIEKARRMTIVSELSELETAEGQASGYGSGEYFAGDPRYGETYVRAVRAVTAADLAKVARRYLRPEQSSLAVLAPEGPAETKAATTADAVITPPTRHTLSNGTPLILREDHRLPFVYVCVAFNGGLLAEVDANNGITQMMSQLLLRGTPGRSAEEIAEAVDGWGASLSVFAGRNSLGIRGRCLVEDVDDFLALMAECATQAAFPQAEIEKQRELQLAAIQREQERPFTQANQALLNMLFPGHPYRWSVQGSADTVGTIDRNALQAHHAKLIAGKNMVMAIFGALASPEADALAQKYFGEITAGKRFASAASDAAPELPAETTVTANREQVIYMAGFPTVPVDDARRDVLTVLDRAMSGLSSDLSIELREKRGLVYYSGASQLAGLEPGMFFVYAGTRTDALNDVETLVAAELDRIRTTGLRQEEIDRARKQLLNSRQEELQNNMDLAMSAALDELYGLGFDHGFHLEARLRGITAQRVRDVAAELLAPERLGRSTLLPAEKP